MSARQPPLVGPDRLLAEGASSLGLQLDPIQRHLFRVYREEIARWAARVGLTALRGPEEIVRDGFLDSLACLPLVPAEAIRILDIGSGAGFPAVPLKIMRPVLQFTLVESSRKKVTFLRHIVRRLDLRDIRVVLGRAEQLAVDPTELGAYDLALARAVAPLPKQAQLAAPFLRAGGLFLAQVGPGLTPREARMVAASKEYDLSGEYALPPSLGRPGRRVLGLRRLGGSSAG